jgi:hypothetical protein
MCSFETQNRGFPRSDEGSAQLIFNFNKMLIEKPNPDVWWSGVSSELRQSCCDLMKIVDDVRPDEVLELGFNGRNISTVLISMRTRIDPQTTLFEVTPETWWAGLCFAHREFVQELVGILKELQRDCEKLLEIRNSGNSIKAILVLKLNHPTEGNPQNN